VAATTEEPEPRIEEAKDSDAWEENFEPS